MKKLFHIILILILILKSGFGLAQNINKVNIVGPMGTNINSFSGNLYLERTDIEIPGRKLDLKISFSYNAADFKLNLGYGNGWRFNYTMAYQIQNNGFVVTWNDGRKEVYTPDTINIGSFKSPTGVFSSWTQYAAGKYKLMTKNRVEYFFDDSTHKQLTKIQEPNGNSLVFGYTDSLISTISDGLGRSIQLIYTGPYLTQVQDANGTLRNYFYQYDGYGNIKQVTDPLGNSIQYEYLINGPLSKIIDKNSNAVDIIYNPSFSVKEVISCNSRKSFTYSRATGTTNVVDYLENGQNQVTKFVYNIKGNLIHKEGNCCGYKISYEYDDNNNIFKKTDANGKIYNFNNDHLGNLLKETDPQGNTINYTYDTTFNNITSVVDKNGNYTTYLYDNNGNLIEISKPEGVKLQYTYSANGDMLTSKDGMQHITNYSYNVYGYNTAIQKPLGSNTTFTYDMKGRKLSETDPSGNITQYSYDLLDRLVSKTDALGNTSSYTYDPNGNILSYTNENTHTTTFSYDASDRLVGITNALGKTKTMSYDAMGNLTISKNELGNATTYTYDNLNRKISETNPNGEKTQYAYDNNGNLVTTSLPNGNTINYTYDVLNRLITVADNISAVASYGYDAKGNKLSETNGNGNTITRAFDALDREVTITDPLGGSISYTYDFNDNVLSYVDRNGHSTSYTYDALNRQVSKTDRLNYTTSFTYDPAGNLLSITDANNHTTSYQYDASNRNTRETYANSTFRQYSYDAVGNIVSRLDGNGATTNYSYDALNRLILRDFPGANDDVYAYDHAGRMISAINSFATVNFTYDNAGRITSESLNGKVTGYNFNISANEKMVLYPSGRVIKESYDIRSRLVEVKDGSTTIANFTYDAGNRNISLSYSNSTQTFMTYDANDRMLTLQSNPTGFINYSYSYDAEGNKLFEKKNHIPNYSEQYSYDQEQRLTQFKKGLLDGTVIPSPLTQIQYNYDGLGNRTTVNSNGDLTTYTANNVNAYTSISDSITIQPLHDNNGNLTYDGNFTYTYDQENRVINVNNGIVGQYQYDALGRRIKKILSGSTVNYYLSGYRVIEERDNIDSILTQYTYSAAIDHQLTMMKNGQTWFYHQNNLGSVQTITNTSGIVVERYEYDAYGNLSIYDPMFNLLNTSTIGNVYFYTGRELDLETGSFYYRFRHYNSVFGRFNQFDPLGFLDQINLLNYVSNNPIKYNDPFGLEKHSPFCELKAPEKCPNFLNPNIQNNTPEKYREYDNIKHYDGKSAVFHCGFRTIVSLEKSIENNKYNECVYDRKGYLVTKGACKGTPDDYSATNFWDALRHLSWMDSGGIWAEGIESFKASRQYYKDHNLHDPIIDLIAKNLIHFAM
jgi:RHS repeat-associated protein